MRNIGKHSKEEEKDKELESAFNNFKNTIKDALTDLVTLEVNSVLVSNISADHPSTDLEFLHQTCIDLADWFERNKIDVRVQKPLEDRRLSQLRGLLDNDKRLECDDGIKQLKDDIKACLAHKPGKLDANHNRSEYRRHLRYLLKYLELHCSKEWDGVMLEGREHQQLRKLWELVGTEYIYAQTVLDLDGDIVSRINDRLFRTEKGRDNAEELMRFHKWNVEGGVNYRNGLMNTFIQIIRALFGK